MDTVETLIQASNAITEEPVKIEVEIEPQNWLHGKLQKWAKKYFPSKKVLLLHPIRMGSLIRISKLVLTIEPDVMKKLKSFKTDFEATAFSHDLVAKHAETLVQVAALAIHNKKSNPPGALVDLIRDQFAPKALLQVLIYVLRMMDTQNFIASIISIRGLSLMEMNPQIQESQIAPGTSSEE